jgi:short-subunit dehydrogenase
VATEFNETAGIVGRSDARLAKISMTPRQVADTALRALGNNRRICVPGTVAKIQIVGSALTPTPILLPMLHRFTADLQAG